MNYVKMTTVLLIGLFLLGGSSLAWAESVNTLNDWITIDPSSISYTGMDVGTYSGDPESPLQCTTNHETGEADNTPPRITGDALQGILIQDESPLYGATVWEFNRKTGEYTSKSYYPGHGNKIITISPTDLPITQSADRIPFVSASDEHSNTTWWAWNGNEALLEAQEEALTQLIAHAESEQPDTADNQPKAGAACNPIEIGTITIISAGTKPYLSVDGSWGIAGIKNKMIETFPNVKPILDTAVTGNVAVPWPSFKVPTYGQFTEFQAINGVYNPYGVGIAEESFDLGELDYISVMDFVNETQMNFTLDKLGIIAATQQSVSPNKIPVFVVDFINSTKGTLAFYTTRKVNGKYTGFIVVGYLNHSTDNSAFGLSYSPTLSARSIAHELGHVEGLGHASNTNSLMHKNGLGSHFDEAQVVAISDHLCSEGSMPPRAGAWGKIISISVCGDALLDRGVDNLPNATMETCERNLAGYFFKSEAATVQLNDDIQADGTYHYKYSPIYLAYGSTPGTISNGEGIVIKPVLNYQEGKGGEAELQKLFDRDLYPDIKICMPENIGELRACESYTFCNLVCELGNQPQNENAYVLCQNWCGGDPAYAGNADWLKQVMNLAKPFEPGKVSCASSTSPGHFNPSTMVCVNEGDCSKYNQPGTVYTCDVAQCYCKGTKIKIDPPPK